VRVQGGKVTLDGVLGCRFMRERAESAVRRLGNIATVHNAITLEAEALSSEVQERVGDANVSACASCGEVTLTGSVSSDAARIRAEQAAWSVPGVQRVMNNITIRSSAQSSG